MPFLDIPESHRASTMRSSDLLCVHIISQETLPCHKATIVQTFNSSFCFMKLPTVWESAHRHETTESPWATAALGPPPPRGRSQSSPCGKHSALPSRCAFGRATSSHWPSHAEIRQQKARKASTWVTLLDESGDGYNLHSQLTLAKWKFPNIWVPQNSWFLLGKIPSKNRWWLGVPLF